MAGLQSYQIYSVTIPPGGSVQYDATGEYVACVEASGDFFVGVDNSTPQFMQQGLAFRVQSGERFEALSLENPSGGNISITIAVGNGDFRDSRLSLSAAVTVDEIQAPIEISNFPPALTGNDLLNKVGDNFLVEVAAGLPAVVPLFLPADNLNGAILRTFEIYTHSGTMYAVYAGAAAPADVSDATQPCIIRGSTDMYHLASPIVIPAGRGLWRCITSNPKTSATWDFL